MRFYRKAELIFLAENITVTGSRVNINIPVTSISRVYCMDDTSLTGKSREKLTIYYKGRDN